jgi:hypothetical protein
MQINNQGEQKNLETFRALSIDFNIANFCDDEKLLGGETSIGVVQALI